MQKPEQISDRFLHDRDLRHERVKWVYRFVVPFTYFLSFHFYWQGSIYLKHVVNLLQSVFFFLELIFFVTDRRQISLLIFELKRINELLSLPLKCSNYFINWTKNCKVFLQMTVKSYYWCNCNTEAATGGVL